MAEIEFQQMPVVKPTADSKLEQLVASYEDVKAKAKEYEMRLEALKNAIKVEMVSAAPGHNRIRLESPYLNTPYRLVAKPMRRLNGTAFKASRPDIWEEFAETKISWYFEADA